MQRIRYYYVDTKIHYTLSTIHLAQVFEPKYIQNVVQGVKLFKGQYNVLQWND